MELTIYGVVADYHFYCASRIPYGFSSKTNLWEYALFVKFSTVLGDTLSRCATCFFVRSTPEFVFSNSIAADDPQFADFLKRCGLNKAINAQ